MHLVPVFWGAEGSSSSSFHGHAEFMQFPVSHTSPGWGSKARGLVSSHGESVAGGGRPSIITFGRPLVEQQPFPLVLANEKLLAGFQRKGTRSRHLCICHAVCFPGLFYLESRNQHLRK